MPRYGLRLLTAVLMVTAMLGACDKGDAEQDQPVNNRAKIRDAEIYVAQLKAEVEMYVVFHGQLPETLEALTEETEHGRITEAVREDPWGAPYEYQPQDDYAFQLFSRGPDGQAGSDDDIHALE